MTKANTESPLPVTTGATSIKADIQAFKTGLLKCGFVMLATTPIKLR